MESITPNWFATVALLSWPLVALWLYRARPVGQATIWTILGGQLLLPVDAIIKLAPGIPNFDKISIPNLAALVGCMLVLRRPFRFWNGFGFTELLVAMSIICPFITSELNNDPIVIGHTFLPSIGHYEALSAVVNELLLLLPFFLGRQFLRSATDNADIMRILVIAGLLYSIPILFEIRFSPQLHYWFYGYFPRDFSQQVRDGGFRPTVFMGHGLSVAFFAMTTVVAAAACWRTRIRVGRLAPAVVMAYLSTILVLCKSAGSLVYGAALVPLVCWAKPGLQLRIALVLVTIALLYPLLRIADLVPTRSMVEVATSFSVDRASSLETRFDQEKQLLAHASDRFLFGWGRYGRNLVYEAGSGRNISIPDGRWIITLGEFGLFGFLAEFGLLALPVFRGASALRFTESVRDRVLLAALALILAVNVIDQLPNSGLTAWSWLLAGALLGRAEALQLAAPRRKPRLKTLTAAAISAENAFLQSKVHQRQDMP